MISQTWSQIAQPEKHNSLANSPMNVLNRNSSISHTPGSTALSFYKHQASNVSSSSINKDKLSSSVSNSVSAILDQPNEENILNDLNSSTGNPEK